MNKKIFKNGLAVVSAVVIGISSVIPVSATTLSQMFKPKNEPVKFEYNEGNSYKEVLNEFEKKGYASAGVNSISVSANRFEIKNSVKLLTYKGKNSVLYWDESVGKVKIELKTEKDGLYTYGFTYNSGTKESAPIVREMLVDGKLPYEECNTLTFKRKWICDGEIVKNVAGDEVNPISEQSDDWQSNEFTDISGVYSKPYQIYLSKGVHTFEFDYISMNVYISDFFLKSFNEPKSYSEVEKEYKEKGYEDAGEDVCFEAEDSLKFSSSSVMRVGSDGNPSCTPISRGFTVMNIVGNSANGAGTYADFNFSVKKTGLYKLGIRVLNNTRDGLPTYRKIEIDGEIPFSELSEYKILDTDGWDVVTVGKDKDNPYLFYLEEGEHVLRLTSLQGRFSEINDILEESSTKLSDMILQINMIIGNDPDYNYDYHLDTQIPDLIPTMDLLVEKMEEIKKILNEISEKNTAKYNELENFISQIKSNKKDIFKLPRKVKDFETLLSQYGTWIDQFALSPLSIDKFYIVSEKCDLKNKKAGFIQTLYTTFVNFFVSFSKDYNGINSTKDVKTNKTIDVWISRGTAWGNMTKTLIDSSFTPKYGTSVNINIVPAGQLNAGAVNTLMLAIASGRAPDVCLGVASGSVGEFAFRNVLKDVSELEGYEELSKNFYPTMLIPNTYKNKVYGIPETMNFQCMIYRKDILANIGASIPSTWDDVKNELLPILKQNNMDMFIPVSSGYSIYSLLFFQNGGKLFTDDLSKCTLNTELSCKAFSDAVDLIRVYGIPISMSFYNRFRTGDAPIGLVDMTVYMQVLYAAPEIRGKWGISVIPGTVREDGTVDRTYPSGSETSAVLIDNDEDKTDVAWDFVKWWMSYDTQVSYGYSIEAEMGTAARWNSANIDAFYAMAWDKDDLKVIKECQSSIDAKPVVFGSYYLDRYINNAYNAVAISGKNMREQIENAAATIDAELERRQK